MRLICGLVRLDGVPADRTTLDAMVTALTFAGLRPCIALRVEGAAALAVLDFSATGQLKELPRGVDDTWLAADVRLDRPAELAATLGLSASSGMENLILAAQTRWDKDVPDKVDGDFAFATWNPKRKRLLCARDIVGTRPLCYAHQPGRLFAFASLPKGLHGSGVISPLPDEIALGRLLANVTSPGEGTGFRDISWLLAGHSATVTAEGLHLHRSWQPNPRQVGTWRGTSDEAAAILRNLVEQAVACRLPPSGSVAAHLSGGLDSSAITVIAARQLRAQNRRLYAYSQVAEPRPGVKLRDERVYIEPILAQERDIVWAPVHMQMPDATNVTDDDLPAAGILIALENKICSDAVTHGAQLLLSGAGGDETATYNAIGIYTALLRKGRWTALWSALRARAAIDKRPLCRVAIERLLAPLLPEWLLAARRFLLGRPRRYDEANALEYLTPRFRAKIKAAIPARQISRNRPQDRIGMLTDSYVVGRANFWSILGARHGIAFTYPLLDRRIIDFILSLPLERFLMDGLSRQPYRAAMAGILPDIVRLRDNKFSPFPDLPLRVVEGKSGMLERVERLRASAAITPLFDLDAMAATFRAVPDMKEATSISETLNSGSNLPISLRRALDALRCLHIAEHIARFS